MTSAKGQGGRRDPTCCGGARPPAGARRPAASGMLQQLAASCGGTAEVAGMPLRPRRGGGARLARLAVARQLLLADSSRSWPCRRAHAVCLDACGQRYAASWPSGRRLADLQSGGAALRPGTM
ncbi:unnamed protein product [Urochloa humidicola]